MTKLIQPFAVTSSNLTSNIGESDASEYVSTVTYAAGATVMWTIGTGATHHIYQSIAGSNLGNALTDTTKWLDLGPTNRWAMFDTANGTPTTGSSIDVTVNVTGRSDGVALLNIDAETVQVTASTVADGILYNQTYSLLSDSGVTSWYAYFSEAIYYNRDLVLTDLPMSVNPTVRVQITKASGTVSLGTMVLGQTKDLGAVTYGARANIMDFSRKELDSFGNYTIVPRSYSKRTTLKLVTDSSQVDSIYSLLADYRTTPAVWVGSDSYAATWVFGFYRDFAIEIAQLQKSYLTLEIEGLT